MMKHLQKFVILVAAVAVGTQSAAAQSRAASNQLAPAFALTTADGSVFDLAQQRGKVVVVNFWATWCGPCRREIPDFIQAYNEYRDEGLEIVGVSLDEDGWDAVRPFLKTSKINYPVVIGDGRLARAYGNVQVIPTTFIVDKNGYVAGVHRGLMTKDQLIAKIKPLL